LTDNWVQHLSKKYEHKKRIRWSKLLFI